MTTFIQRIKNLFKTNKPEPQPSTLHDALQEGYVEITFRKVNGKTATKIATQNPKLMPDEARPKGGKTPLYTLPFYSVYDDAWRGISTKKGLILDWKYIGKELKW